MAKPIPAAGWNPLPNHGLRQDLPVLVRGAVAQAREIRPRSSLRKTAAPLGLQHPKDLGYQPSVLRKCASLKQVIGPIHEFCGGSYPSILCSVVPLHLRRDRSRRRLRCSRRCRDRAELSEWLRTI